ncbi:uncharacterized protein KIAA0930 homolog isoform X2 [Dysidea avara]|uniref:uncharacterized protein KIAA0930 homolog isoform X2 n=1 Tax=Dysidea avara TaxID=196820 RepID=UPI0033183A2B
MIAGTRLHVIQHVYVTFADEAAMLTIGTFKQWYLKQPSTTADSAATAATDDDLLFFVRKSVDKGESKVDVARKDSPTLPSVDDDKFSWPESFFLNVVLHEFEYRVTVASCTVHHTINVIHKKSLKVFPSPTKQRMDRKSKESETIYPDIFFSIDDFEQSFKDVLVKQDGEKIAVELTAINQAIGLCKLVFSGMVDYSAVYQAFYNREKAQTTTSLASKIASFTPFKNRSQTFVVEQPAQYIRLRGPRKTGFAELAVSKHMIPKESTPNRRASKNLDNVISVVSYTRRDSPPSIVQPEQPATEQPDSSTNTDQVPKDTSDSTQKLLPGDQVLNGSLTYVMLNWQTILDAILYGDDKGKLS